MGRRRRLGVVPVWMTVSAVLASLLMAAGVTLRVIHHVDRMEDSLVELHLPDPEVYVAARELPVGHVFTLDDVRTQPFAGWEPPSGLLEPRELVGRTLRERILEGDFIRPERFADEGLRPGLSALVPRQYRAISINVSDADRVSDFVEPGDHVDLLVTLRSDTGLETVRLLELRRILAIDEQTSRGKIGTTRIKPQVTLLTTAHEAERLALALQSGRPRLVLRSDQDLVPSH